MSTLRQIQSNRRNAQNSTGPRTPEGKAASRFNALKHGIDADSQCLPSEDPAALSALAAEYHERFAPATPEERALVDVLISSEWDLRRYRVAAAQLWQMSNVVSPHNALPTAKGFEYKEVTHMRLQRAQELAWKRYNAALRDLRTIQSAREEPAEIQETKPQTPKLASFPKSPSHSDPTPQVAAAPENQLSQPHITTAPPRLPAQSS